MSALPTAAKGTARSWRRALHSDARHLHQVEVAGESPETPLIAILEVALFLLPIAAVMLGVALVAAHYFG